jgi:hypothetical protein
MLQDNLDMPVNCVLLRIAALCQRCVIAPASAHHHGVVHACGEDSAIRRAYGH